MIKNSFCSYGIYVAFSLLCIICNFSTDADQCPNGLKCNGRCCVNQANDFYCCPEQQDQDRVYMVGMSSWWKDYWGVVIGCIIGSIIISVVLSIVCCLFCNGCWWHRRRHPDIYSGGFPLGTLVYSPYFPPWYDSNSVDRHGRQQHRVHFTDDDLSSTGSKYEAPRSVLKNKNTNGSPPNGTLQML